MDGLASHTVALARKLGTLLPNYEAWQVYSYPQPLGLVLGLHLGGSGVVFGLPRVTTGTTTMGMAAMTPNVIAVPLPM